MDPENQLTKEELDEIQRQANQEVGLDASGELIASTANITKESNITVSQKSQAKALNETKISSNKQHD